MSYAFSLRLNSMKYSYEIKYSDRKTVAISIAPNNKITLRCPKGMGKGRAERFLQEKSEWIEKVFKKNENKINKNADLMSYEKILVGGEKFPLYTGSIVGDISRDGVCVPFVKDVKKVYTEAFEKNFILRLKKISASTGLFFNTVKIKDFKSRWGSCDGNNNLKFNYKLFMLPEYIQYYIIIHELCHTVEHNHSENFWALVKRFVPDYKQAKNELKKYNFITTLY